MIRRLRNSLAGKLLLAQLLVIVAGSATLALVALSVAPGLFRGHVREALGIVPEDVSRHLDQAFGDAVLVALAVAIGAAAVTAAAVSWFLSLRIVRPLGQLARAAERIAQGNYGERVPRSGSDELAILAAAFNDMAASLESSELRRRQLLSDVAHELRTPLATIEGYIEGVRDGVMPASTEIWAVLESEGARLRRLVDDLHKVSRAEERQLDLHIQPVSAAEVVRASVQAAQPAYDGKGVELGAEVDERLPQLLADSDRIGEVLANLLDNALRHTPPGGRVTVAAERTGGNVDLVVADNGEGIPAEHVGRIFERFYRVDSGRTRERGGSGIGLAIARALVEAHGGRIRVESEGTGTGARFVVTLPTTAGVRRDAHASSGLARGGSEISAIQLSNGSTVIDAEETSR